MRIIYAAAALACALCFLPAPQALAEEESPGTGTVFVLPIRGPIDKSMLYVFRRAFREAKSVQPDAVILDIDTPGGRLKETEEIITWMRSVDVPVYAFVNPHAISAGAIISLGCDRIFMAPSGNIGSAMPIMLSPVGGGVQQLPPDVKEKMLSVVRSMVRGLAQEKGHSDQVATAMVDPELELQIGDRVVCRKGELLNLTAREAIEIIPPETSPLLAQAMVDDVPALLRSVNLDTSKIVRFEEQGLERLARYITALGPILLALGVLGLFIEFKTPGFGVPGIAGICLLAVFFFGHYVAGLAGLEDILLVGIGLVLLAVEIFVIPGFGITGFLGIACIMAGLILGMVPYLPTDVAPLPEVEPLSLAPYLEDALLRFTAAAAVIALCGWGLSKILPKTTFYNNLVLQTALTQDKGFVSSNASRYREFLSSEGIAATSLRPAGIAMFGEERLDVVSSGDLIAKGTRVQVIEVQGARVVVEPLPEPPEQA